MEPRCFSCICAGCPNEDTCENKPCKEGVSVFECVEVLWPGECEVYDKLYGYERRGDYD